MKQSNLFGSVSNTANTNELTELQEKQIAYGKSRGVDVSIYAKPHFNFAQMVEICEGLLSDINTSSYARTKLSWQQMHAIRAFIENSPPKMALFNDDLDFLLSKANELVSTPSTGKSKESITVDKSIGNAKPNGLDDFFNEDLAFLLSDSNDDVVPPSRRKSKDNTIVVDKSSIKNNNMCKVSILSEVSNSVKISIGDYCNFYYYSDEGGSLWNLTDINSKYLFNAGSGDKDYFIEGPLAGLMLTKYKDNKWGFDFNNEYFTFLESGRGPIEIFSDKLDFAIYTNRRVKPSEILVLRCSTGEQFK